MLSEESDLLYLWTGGSFIYSETNYVKQHEKSQGANAGREGEKERKESKSVTCYKSNTDEIFEQRSFFFPSVK